MFNVNGCCRLVDVKCIINDIIMNLLTFTGLILRVSDKLCRYLDYEIGNNRKNK